MTRVMWFSRHKMTTEQMDDLKRIYGEDVVVLTTAFTKVYCAEEVVKMAEDINADVIACVLPLDIIGFLVNPSINKKPVIRSVSIRVPTGAMIKNPATGEQEEEYMFSHAGWEQVLRLDIVTKWL